MHQQRLSAAKFFSLCLMLFLSLSCKTSQLKQSSIQNVTEPAKEAVEGSIETNQAIRFELPVRPGKRLSFKEQTLIKELFVMTSRYMVFKSRIIEDKDYAGTKPRLKDLQKISRYNFYWSLLKLSNWLFWLNFEKDYNNPVIYSIAFKNKESQAHYTLTLTRDSSTTLEITIAGTYMPKFKNSKDALNTENAEMIKEFLADQSLNVFRLLDRPLVESLIPLGEVKFVKSQFDLSHSPSKGPFEVLKQAASLGKITEKQLRSEIEAFVYLGQINGFLTDIWKKEYLKKTRNPDELVVSHWVVSQVEQCSALSQHQKNDFVATGIAQCLISTENKLENALNKDSTLFKSLSQQEFVPIEQNPDGKKPKKFKYSRSKRKNYIQLAMATLETLKDADFSQAAWIRIKEDYPITLATSFKARAGSAIENSIVSLTFDVTANSLNTYQDLAWPSATTNKSSRTIVVKLSPRASESGLAYPAAEVERAMQNLRDAIAP